MTRLDPLPLRDLTADQRTLRDSVTTSRGLRVDEGSPLPGPFEAWLRSPRAGLAAARLGESIGSAQVLPAAQRELVILVVAAHYRAGVVFLAHSRIAGRAGIDAGVIDAIRDGDPRAERLTVCSVAAGLVRAGRVDPEAYRRAVTELGEDGLVELVLTVGYYVLVALTVNTVDADLPPGTAPVW